MNTHGKTIKAYAPLSNSSNYVFNSASNVLWYNERNSIKKVELGQEISPTSTAYWFYGANYMSYGDFTNLDTSDVTTMRNMFDGAGNNSSVNTFTLIGLNNWKTEKVTIMQSMFYNAGYYAKEWSIGDLSNWKTEKVTNMQTMFYQAGYNASTNLDSIGSLDIYATNIYRMFYNARYMKATLNIYSNPASGSSGYQEAFRNAANQTGSLITVNYSSATTNIDNIIATKSSNSIVVKGSLLS